MLKMILDVKTCWNSIYYMIERFLKLSSIISGILLTKSYALDMLTGRELNELKEICSLLHPLENLTTKISGEKYAVISTILPLLNCVKSATKKLLLNQILALNYKKVY